MKRILYVVLVCAASRWATGSLPAQVIIANPSVKATAISVDELRDVFTGATSNLKDGSRTTPVMLKSGAVQLAFLKTYVGKNDSAFQATWRGVVFAGQGVMPKFLNSEEEMVDYVAKTSGAVGYVSKDTHSTGVKVLTVH